jgi:L-fuculose-phosphate aldolase
VTTSIHDPIVDELIEAGRELWVGHLVTSHGGNLSVRRDGGALVTATGSMLGRLTPGDFVEVDAHGAPRVDQPAAPSSDTRIHMAVYDAVRGAQVVLHAHPVYAVALSFEWPVIEPINVAGQEIVGRVPVIDAEWRDSGEPLARALRDHSIVVARGHGSYARASTIWEAFQLTSALEEAAQVLWLHTVGERR